jgi:hypothetical protein
MTVQDKLMRRFCGAVCESACCSGMMHVEGRRAEGRVVGGDGGGVGDAEVGTVGWTRFSTPGGRLGAPTARYDLAVADGCEEGAWRLVEQVPAEDESGAFSDHLLITVERLVTQVAERELRAVAVARGQGLQEIDKQDNPLLYFHRSRYIGLNPPPWGRDHLIRIFSFF